MTLADRITTVADELRTRAHRVSLGGHELAGFVAELNSIAAEMRREDAAKIPLKRTGDTNARQARSDESDAGGRAGDDEPRHARYARRHAGADD